MPLTRKLGLTAAIGCIAVVVLGTSPASAVEVELRTGLNSPQGSKTVKAPDAAVPGVLNGFTSVLIKGPGSLSNIDVSVG